MPRVNTEAIPERQPKDLRYRRQLFPGSDDCVFNTSESGFVPLPIILRKLLRHLSAPEVRVLLYLYLRASRHDKRFIATRSNAGRTFFLIHDPRVAIKHLVAVGQVSESDLFEINEPYADLNQARIDSPIEQPSASVPPAR
jgi:hypothetical protein